MRNRIWLCLGLTVAAPGTALAQDKVTISIAGIELEAPMPAGYCLPTGKHKAVAELVAAADTENVTLATLFRCDLMAGDRPPGNDYYLIKTPRKALVLKISRAQLIEELGKEFGKAEWQEGGEKVADLPGRVSESVSGTFNTPVEMTGSFAPRGTDADCIYMGGEVQVSMAGLSYPIQAGACMTAAADKMLAVYAYDDPETDGIARLMRKSRALAIAFEPVAAP